MTNWAVASALLNEQRARCVAYSGNCAEDSTHYSLLTSSLLRYSSIRISSLCAFVLIRVHSWLDRKADRRFSSFSSLASPTSSPILPMKVRGESSAHFSGPLGASAAIIGFVAGLGELMGYGLRSVSG